MRHLLSRVLALVVTLSISMGSHSANLSGSAFQTFCAVETDSIDYGICLGFVRGLHMTHEIYGAISKNYKVFCLPPNVSTTQLVKIISKYLENHPENLHLEAASTAFVALKKVFPCEDGQ